MQLHRDIDVLRDRDADLFIIGNGSPSFIEGFREQTGYSGPIYVDPSLAVYRAAELKRSVTRTLDPRSLGKGVKAFLAGHRQGMVKGDAWQQGGVVVVAPSGDIKWHQASERPDDRASAQQIAAAI